MRVIKTPSFLIISLYLAAHLGRRVGGKAHKNLKKYKKIKVVRLSRSRKALFLHTYNRKRDHIPHWEHQIQKSRHT